MNPKSFKLLLTAALLMVVALGVWGAYGSARPPASGDITRAEGTAPAGTAVGPGKDAPHHIDRTASGGETVGVSQPDSPVEPGNPLHGEGDGKGYSRPKEESGPFPGSENRGSVKDWSREAGGTSSGQPPGAPLSGNGAGQVTVTLLVTRDFGREVLVEVKQEYRSGETALSLLQGRARVETAYGGNFVEAINDLKSTSGGPEGRQDWFYFINGVAAGTGSATYRLRAGDFVWWDYHSWQASGIIPAVVGCYPCPFSRGYGDKGGRALVLAAPRAEKEAAVLKASWARMGIEAEVEKVSEKLLAGRRLPTLALGTWEDLRQIESIAGLNERGARSGLFGRFESERLSLISAQGKSNRTVPAGAVIQATGQGLGDMAPLWLVIGTDADWLQKAVALLQEEPEKLQSCYGLALTPEGDLRLPLAAGRD